MGLSNRPYWKETGGDGGGDGFGGGLRLALPRPTKVVLGIMIACGALFLLTAFTEDQPGGGPLDRWLSLKSVAWWQLWRYVTFQFLHAGPSHLLWNLVGLYFFGPPLERIWGQRKFLVFYLACGCVAGLAYVILTLCWPVFSGVPLVGASGGIFACVAACAVLFPEMKFLIIPIRWVAGLLFLFYILTILQGAASHGLEAQGNSLSDAAHLGGMVAALLWLWGLPRLSGAGDRVKARLGEGNWQRKLEQRARQQQEVDRILQKVHEKGLASLSAGDKRTLRQATERQQKEDRRIGRA